MRRIYRHFFAALSGALTGAAVSYFVPAAVELVSMIPFIFMLLLHAEENISERRFVTDSHAEPYDGSGGRRTLRRELKKSVRSSLSLGFTYFYAYYLAVFHWFLSMYPLDFTAVSRGGALVAVLAAWLGLALLQTLFAMLQAPVFYLVMHSRFLSRSGTPRLSAPFMYAGIYVIFEFAQTLTWAGVPWGRLALAQTDFTLFIQSASLFGSYFVSFIIVSINGCLALGVFRAYKMRVLSRGNKKNGPLKKNLPIAAAAFAALAAFAVNLGIGAAVLTARADDTDDRSFIAAALQGNVSSADKWRDGSFAAISKIYSELTLSAAGEGADIVVWPETVIATSINESEERQIYLMRLAIESDTALFATAFWRETVESDDEADDDGASVNARPYNCVFFVTPEGGIETESIYAKRRIVPFGEFVPFEDVVKVLIPPLANLGLFSGNIVAGDEAVVYDTEFGGVGPLICFDSIYESLSMDSVRNGAEILTISTNDSWFGESAALYQHAAQASLRAVELDRYVVRSGNTGISCIISPTGEVISELSPNTRGYIVEKVYMRDTRTLYSVIGNSFVALAAAAYLMLACEAAFSAARRRSERINCMEK